MGVHSFGDHIAVELIGTDRPGLLSEIFAVLANQHCNVVAAEVWTHKTRVACVIYINADVSSRMPAMEEQLRNVLRGGDDLKGARTSFSMDSTHVDRRLHQLMLADKDYEDDDDDDDSVLLKPVISIGRCEDKGYSVVNVKCKDRTKLLFDIVCTLTDMQFVVSHASVSSDGTHGLQVHRRRRRRRRRIELYIYMLIKKCLLNVIVKLNCIGRSYTSGTRTGRPLILLKKRRTSSSVSKLQFLEESPR